MNRCYGFVEDGFLSSVDAFIFNSADTAKRVLARPGTDKPFVIARPGRDHRRATVTQSDIRRRAAGPGPVTILFVGNVIPRKGLHVLLKALAPLAGHDWRLLVAGSLDDAPAYVRAIARQLSRSGLTSRVTLLGRVSDRALTGLFRDSHLLAVPSFHEGYGIVYIEAMGSGLPVIAGSQGGAREIVDHGYNGFLVEPGDADVLTGHIASLIDDRKTLLAMGFAAFKSHADQPTWEDTGESVHRFLHSLRAG